MVAGVAMTTKTQPPPDHVSAITPLSSAGTVRMDVRMIFSHRPQRIRIEGYAVDEQPDSEELEFSLTLPRGKVIDLPLDIDWPEKEHARYFTQIIIRSDSINDKAVVFSDQITPFSDTFTIDTREKKP